MSNRALLTDWMQRHIQDEDDRLGISDRDLALNQALAEHGRRWPLEALVDMTGDGTTVFFALPATYQRDWSRIQTIESPLGEQPPVRLTDAQWSLYLDIDDETQAVVPGILFATAPALATMTRVSYTGAHTATSAMTSVLPQHQYAVAMLGAAFALEMLATLYAAQSDSSFQADTTDHAGRSQRYAERASRLRDLYAEQTPMRDSSSTLHGRIMFKTLVRI